MKTQGYTSWSVCFLQLKTFKADVAPDLKINPHNQETISIISSRDLSF